MEAIIFCFYIFEEELGKAVETDLILKQMHSNKIEL